MLELLGLTHWSAHRHSPCGQLHIQGSKHREPKYLPALTATLCPLPVLVDRSFEDVIVYSNAADDTDRSYLSRPTDVQQIPFTHFTREL